MEDDYVIIHSPLEQRVTQAGIFVEVKIYHGQEDNSWILEIVDHLGGSTVWEDPFQTDKAALEEAIGMIEVEGIASFTATQNRTAVQCTETKNGKQLDQPTEPATGFSSPARVRILAQT